MRHFKTNIEIVVVGKSHTLIHLSELTNLYLYFLEAETLARDSFLSATHHLLVGTKPEIIPRRHLLCT